ncbi:ABC efflux transporter, putative [Penicillium digitatum]|uniref:ABC efflux transporter, putative n=1 Tax=Penicillium digitatum TaxID=36651 RepID=A0A7T6XH15_PENDI|nr:ABC efflux transporter, putative [Penicillium digitatum]
MEKDEIMNELSAKQNILPADVRDTTYHLTLRAVDPVCIKVRNVSLKVHTTPPIWETSPLHIWQRLRGQRPPRTSKTVLDNVSASMPSGSLTAIFGSSGSGKTSLLNLMANRMSLSRANACGTTTFNDNPDIAHIRSAYVVQEDVLIPTLTVRETLRYSADLRLPPPTTPAERCTIVEQVLLELGLKECADTRIGTTAHKGCSGGEKRRTSIGVQLLANPSVLFCDEPTTGLDATSAFQIIRTLKRLALDGRTVVVSIHAPRSEIWSLFDNVVLLARGAAVYSGSIQGSLAHFEECGHVLPPFVNPAEFLIDLAAVDNRTEALEAASNLRVERLREVWRSKQTVATDSEAESKREEEMPKREVGRFNTGTVKQASFRRQLCVLTSRTFKTTIRDPMGVAGSLLEAAGIRSREGSLYTASSLNGYLILLFETYRLTIDVRLFDRERNEGVVNVSSFLLSRRAARLLLEDLPVPLIFSLVFYFMVGYRLDAAQFCIFFVLSLLTHYIAVTFAAVAIGVARSFPGASLVANLSFTLQSFACGYFVQSNQIPVYVRWLKWSAYTFYIFGALCANEFIGPNGPEMGQFYACPYSNDPLDPACKQYTGRYIMESLAALLLRYNRFSIDIAQARETEGDPTNGKTKLASRPTEEARKVAISLDKYALDIQRRRTPWATAEIIQILRPITADFQPGELNIIMGPSGSGKTSLLNSIAHRLHGSMGTQYRVHGTMLYNGAVPSNSVIRSVTSFVTQDDDALMPSLTVRESLRFAAGLRLPTWMTSEEKNRRAEEILLKMGPRECADNVIGSELIKGVSGGEKRRVTIAIQILTDPKVLLLDEPTSGLDAFTAMSIIELLHSLAAEGRTLVLTLHQSRSDLFAYFSQVLLLARGGYPVYAGPGTQMLAHFAKQGHECPRTTNPADFVLDLITVDFQQADHNRLKLGFDRQMSQIATPAELGSLKRQMLPFRVTFPLVLHRSVVHFWRQPPLVMARSMQIPGIAIIMALFFAPLKNDYAAVQSRMGFIQEFAALYFVGMLQNIAIYPSERDIFYREEADNCYTASTFILGYTAIEIPFEIVSSLIFGALAAFVDNLHRTVTMFLISAFNCFCIISCGESVGIMFCTLFSHVGFAVNVTSTLLSISTILGGVMSLNVNNVLQALNHLSPIKYAIANLAPYSMHGQVFHCSDSQKLVNGSCPVDSGEQVLQLYNLDKNGPINVMALGICTVIYRVVAYAFIKALRSHKFIEQWRKWRAQRKVSEA